ncbi:hypothetical protein BDZ89DRAFT_560640 [Hymenopellis radicata]|nr:hypothetical protein BDZ89DRAFT_560640 [Hymenopellis radicata]
MAADAGRLLTRRDSTVVRDQQGTSKWVLHSCYSSSTCSFPPPSAVLGVLTTKLTVSLSFQSSNASAALRARSLIKQEPTVYRLPRRTYSLFKPDRARHTLTNQSTPVITVTAALMCQFRESGGQVDLQDSSDTRTYVSDNARKALFCF